MPMYRQRFVTAAGLAMLLFMVTYSATGRADGVATGKDGQYTAGSTAELGSIMNDLEHEVGSQANHLSELSARLYLVEQRLTELEALQKSLKQENSNLRTELHRLQQLSNSQRPPETNGFRWWFIALAALWGLSK